MFRLNRLILIDSYKPGTVQEVRLDGPTNLNGVNGAGKTTLLRLIPLFFGESPGRLVPKSRVNESFARHYLPHDSSYIIFEYRRPRQTCLAVIYASPNEGGLCYRFVDKGFAPEDFLLPQADGSSVPLSCRDLSRHLHKKGIYCSAQLTARNDYRTVIQNLPHTKGAELRQLIARFAFCDSTAGRRLQHIEKIVTGMFMRATDFRDLREMLVSCIEEEKESITLDLRTDTLDNWCREYRAFLHLDDQRERMAALEQAEEEGETVRQALAELAARVRRLAARTGSERNAANAELREREDGLARLKLDWEAEERKFKGDLADLDAERGARHKQLQRLEAERADWEKQDIEARRRLYESREPLRAALDRERENRRRLLDKVNDIEAEFSRLKAEREKEHQTALHALDSRKQVLALEAEREKSQARETAAEQEQRLRDDSATREQDLQQRLQSLMETRGQVSAEARRVPPDPELLGQRDAKRRDLDEAHASLDRSRDQGLELDRRTGRHRDELQRLEQSRRQLAEQRQRAADDETGLLRQLDADAGTLLGFLREHHPAWTGHIAKVVKPELLLRDDLSPALAEGGAGFYGVHLALEALPADRAASEAALREALGAARAELERIGREERRLEDELTAHRKTGLTLDKQRRELDLVQGQARTRLKQIKEEATSLERRIEADRRERAEVLEARLRDIEEELRAAREALARHRSELEERLRSARQELAARLDDIARRQRDGEQRLDDEREALRRRQAAELAELDGQRLAGLARGGVDRRTLVDLEARVHDLEEQLKQAEQAAERVEHYLRWREHEWPRHAGLREDIVRLAARAQEADARYRRAEEGFRKQRDALKSALATLQKTLAQTADQLRVLDAMAEELAGYPRLLEGGVALDASHTVAFLQKQKHELFGRRKDITKRIADEVAALKRALNQFPGTRPASYGDTVQREIGLDAPDRAWVAPLRDWFAEQGDELRRWLVMQATTFGSAVRVYQQALARFDRGIDGLSRRLGAAIDRNIGFDKIEAIHARLISRVEDLGFWRQIVAFTELYDQWDRNDSLPLPSQDFADAVQLIASQLQTQGRVETRLVNLLDLEIAVTENGKQKRATHDEELRQISSHGLSYLILCVFFVALVNMIRRDQPIAVIWPMDELKDLHQINIERLLDILGRNRITLLSAFPDPDPEVLKWFRNRYEIYGYRELVEMVVGEDAEPRSEEPLAMNVSSG